MCVNLKELAMLSQQRRRELQDYSSAVHILESLPFRLTRFLNDYFMQQLLTPFLQSHSMRLKLETLELHNLHLGKTLSGDNVPLVYVRSIDAPVSRAWPYS